MTTLNLPASPAFSTSKFGLESNTQTFLSPLSRSVQTLELPGARWMATYVLPPMKRAEAAAWQAFFVKLRGQAGRFYAFDPDARTPRGVATGTPLIDGGNQTGGALTTKGWTPSVTGILLAGDYVAYDTAAGRQLHMVTADADSDGSGEAALSVEPPIRVSPQDDASLIVTDASCTMMLAAPEIVWDAGQTGVYSLTFDAVEALT